MLKEQLTLDKYEKAFACRNEGCPKRNDEKGCPFWMEGILTNHEDGDTKMVAGCFSYMLELKLNHIWQNTESAAQTVQATRNEITELMAKSRILALTDFDDMKQSFHQALENSQRRLTDETDRPDSDTLLGDSSRA